MTHTHGSFTCALVGRRISFVAALSCALVVLTVSVEAGQQRASLSKDLSDRLAAGVEAPTGVIVAGNDEQLEALATRYGARIKKRLTNAAVFEVSGGQLRDLSEDPEVVNLSGDVPVRTMTKVTAEAIGADQVRAGFEGLRGFTGRGIGVAVIDTGVDATHPYLAGRVALSLDFTGTSVARSPGRDENGHGTHVAGIIRAIAPGAHIVDLKAMGAEGSGFTSNVIAALNWATANKAAWNLKVVNISLGHGVMESERDDPLCQAVQRATDAGLLVTVAAGNLGKLPDGRPVARGIQSPGHSRHALTVGAVNTKQTPRRSDDVMATFSSRGPTMFDGLLKPELVAPGNRILSSVPRGAYLPELLPERVTGVGVNTFMEASGTSMSAAVAAAAAAVLREARALTPAEMKVVLQLTSTAVAGSGLLEAGAGSLNLVGAVAAAMRPADTSTETSIAGEAQQPTLVAYQHLSPGTRLVTGVNQATQFWTSLLPVDYQVSSPIAFSNRLVWADAMIWTDAMIGPTP